MNTSNKDNRNEILQAFKDRSAAKREEAAPQEPEEKPLADAGETEQPQENTQDVHEEDSVEAAEPEQLEEAETEEAEIEAHPEEDSEEEQPQEALSGEDLERVLQSKIPKMINGQEHLITVEEALNGYSRQSDTTRTQQELADERRKVQESASEYTGKLQEVVQKQEMLSKAFDSPRYTQAQLKEALEDDPDKYLRMKAENDEHDELRRIFQQDVEQTKKSLEAEQAKIVAQQAEQGRKYLEGNLPQVLQEETQKELGKYLVDSGYEPKQVASITDGIALGIAWKAMMYDKLSKDAKPREKKAQKVPKVQKRGSPPKSKQQQSNLEYKSKREQFAKTGKRKDGMELMKAYKSNKKGG